MASYITLYMKSLRNPSMYFPKHLWRAQFTTVVTSALGGYLITGIHPKILELFEHPFMQIIACFMIFHLSKSDLQPLAFPIIDALFATASIQLMMYISNRYWNEDDEPYYPRWLKMNNAKSLSAMVFISIICILVSFRIGGKGLQVVDMSP